MDEICQELEFLDLVGLSDDERQSLRSYLNQSPSEQCVQAGSRSPVGNEAVGVSSPQTYEDVGSQQSYEGVEPEVLPVSMGYPTPGSVHPMYQAANMCMTTIPQYQHMANYPVPLFSAPHLVGTGPNYYINMSNPNMPYPAMFPQTHRLMNPPSFSYQSTKRKAPPHSKYPHRKEVPNGHSGDYHQPNFNSHFYPGNIVQAATGIPIVMQQQQQPVHAAAYLPPHTVHIPTPNSQAIYHPVVTFAQTPDILPPPTLQEEVLPTVTTEKEEELAEIVPVVEPQPLVAAPIVPLVVESPPVEAAPVLPPPLPVVESVVAEVVPDSAPPPMIEKEATVDSSATKSWASLFKKSPPATIVVDKPTARVEPFTTSPDDVVSEGDKGAGAVSRPLVDGKIRRLARHLTSYELVPAPLALLPRGLINKGNWCYINATLQALIACPPFVHLVKSLAPFVGGKTEDSATPIMDSVVDFIEQFETVPVRSNKERASSKKEEPHFGTSFEPASIYRMLSKIRSEAFKVEGRQEDAEEFLSCLLNGLHDEMIEVMKSVKDDAVDTPTNARAVETKPNTQQDNEDWQVIGPKNRGCVTRATPYSKTPVSNLFLGLMRSTLHAHANHSSELESYFSLQLDIQNDKVNSVRDALANLVSKEPLTGYVCSKTRQEVEASRQTTFEELPPILILHLKCFVYDKSGGCQKLLKRVEFSSDLELSKEFLSPNQKSKLKERQRQYKLFAVVYHDGKEATKGHYVTEVHHTGTGNWLRFDDSIIRVVDTQLFKYSLPRMPYLLLYRKLNL